LGLAFEGWDIPGTGIWKQAVPEPCDEAPDVENIFGLEKFPGKTHVGQIRLPSAAKADT